MRAGVVDFTFVHWIYTSAWLITTYHLKRLQKEDNPAPPHKLMRIGDGGESSSSLRPNRFEKVTVDQHKGFPNRSDPQRLIANIFLIEQTKSKSNSTFT